MLIRLALAAALAALAATQSAIAETIEVTVEGFQFSPQNIEAKVGDTIVWTNKDAAPHTTTARDGSWDSRTNSGESASVVMESAGTFDYFCRFHPSMTGQVVVSE